MLADAQTADALGSDTLFNSSLLFNTTLKLAHRFLSLPSRALARLRRLDDMALELHVAAQATQQDNSGTPGYRRHRNAGHVGIAPMPGPWGFLTSGYFLGLFVMAFVLNRIQNIVVPPRRPQTFRLHPNHAEYPGRRPTSLRRAVLNTMFPVDFSSTFSRAMFRGPSMYFLGRSVVIWFVLLVHAYDQTLFTRSAWLASLGDWVLSRSMEDICWFTFMSACLALCVGTLTTGLEGLNINDSAPFNLFAFAFQLYVETASARPAKEGEEPSRPNTHVTITILLPLLQLTVMHGLEIQRRWSRYRLALSTANGALALAHFHYVVWLNPVPFPLTTYAARVVESAMLAVVALTVALNAATQLLANGTLARPLLGHAALLPRPNEDFSVALFRLGTASMEATAVAGLGNEVGGVTSARPADVARARARELVRGELEIDRAGVAALTPAYEQRGARRVARKGFANEIIDVKVRAARTDFWMNTVLSVGWHRDFGSFLASMWRAVRRVWAAAVGRARGSPESVRGREPSVASAEGLGQRGEVVEDPYERFIRGETVSDDEDDDFHPGEEGTPQPETDEDDTVDEDEDEDGAGEQARLYADLSQSDASSAPLLLAHMTDKSASPLTRRGYRKLVNRPSATRTGGDDADDWDEFVAERRTAKRVIAPPPDPDEDPASQNARACVICTVEPRDIICWPCRCLALCDDCRNNLASRASASKHACPCCRRRVEGYSKIYIP